MFDVPEQKRAGRDALSYKLRQLGFYRLQKSIFIHPYDCKKEIDFVVHYFGIADYVTMITADRFDGDQKIRERFSC